jgi:hypothetical protein
MIMMTRLITPLATLLLLTAPPVLLLLIQLSSTTLQADGLHERLMTRLTAPVAEQHRQGTSVDMELHHSDTTGKSA